MVKTTKQTLVDLKQIRRLPIDEQVNHLIDIVSALVKKADKTDKELEKVKGNK